VKSKGPGTDFVEKFLKLWQRKDYEAMYDMTRGCPDRNLFVTELKYSPVALRNIVLETEGGSTGDYVVFLSLQVTDPPSVLAAHLLATTGLGKAWSPELGVQLHPGVYGFETYHSVKQPWFILSVEGTPKIVLDRAASGSKATNIMNYIMDASTFFALDVVHSQTSGKWKKLPDEMRVQLEMADLCASFESDLDATEEESNAWLPEAMAKVKDGEETMETLVKAIRLEAPPK